MRSVKLTSVALLLVSGSLLAVPAAATAATAAAPVDDGSAPADVVRCHGKVATMVGSPGTGSLQGTKRRDVIVTNGTPLIQARGGADIICVTRLGAMKPDETVEIIAGKGDDRVYVVGTAARPSYVVLGAGRDRFVGGRGPDQVYAQQSWARPDGATGNDNELDHIDTRGGADEVVAGGDEGLQDRITLGGGDDLMAMQSDRMIAGGHVVGGAGSDTISSIAHPGSTESVIDNTTGTVTADGEALMSFDDMEGFELELSGHVTFVGTRAAESVSLHGALTADLAGGDDRVIVYGDDTGDLDGGAGDDRLLVIPGSGNTPVSLTLDAAAGTATVDSTSIAFSAFEDYFAWADRVALTGSEDDEAIEGIGCTVTVDGRGGDDVLAVLRADFYDTETFCSPGIVDGPPTVTGGEGDDRLVGGNSDDDLDGGAGTDRADGGGGVDVCAAETVVRCEA